MATNNNEAIAKTILAQTIIVANEAAASAAAAQAAADSTMDKAPLISPHFTGIPTAPTASAGTNTTQLATTAYLDGLLNQPNGLPTLDGTGKIPANQIPPQQITAVYVVASQAAMLALSAAVGASAIRTDISNAQFILTALPASTLGNWIEVGTVPVLSVAGLTGAISAADLTAQLVAFVGDSGAGGVSGDVPAPSAGDTAAGKVLGASGAFIQVSVAKLAEGSTGTGAAARAIAPTFTGIPLAPTASVDTNTAQLATCAFVLAQASSSGDGLPIMDGSAARGTSTHYARADHIHPTDTTLAPLANPALTGVPTAPTATPVTNSTQIATTAYADAIAALKANIASPTFTGTPAAPTPSTGDSTTKIATTAFVKAQAYATLASPTFTGVPSAPTATPGTNTTQLATTEFVLANAVQAPSSSAYPIGWSGLMCAQSSVNDGSSLAGNFIKRASYVSGTWGIAGSALSSGQTWVNISGSVLGSGDIGTFVRTA